MRLVLAAMIVQVFCASLALVSSATLADVVSVLSGCRLQNSPQHLMQPCSQYIMLLHPQINVTSTRFYQVFFMLHLFESSDMILNPNHLQ